MNQEPMNEEAKTAKRYHTVKEVAAYFGLSSRQIYKLVEEDRIPVAIHLSRAIRLDLAAVESALLKTGSLTELPPLDEWRKLPPIEAAAMLAKAKGLDKETEGLVAAILE